VISKRPRIQRFGEEGLDMVDKHDLSGMKIKDFGLGWAIYSLMKIEGGL
jgi:hypothetical protein